MLLRYQIQAQPAFEHRYRVRCHLPEALPDQRLRHRAITGGDQPYG